MRPILPLILAAMAFAGTCHVQPPPPALYPVVYFDSGALVRAHMKSGDIVTGRLLTTFAPGGDEFVVCADRREPCARTLPVDSIERVRAHETAAFVAANLGWRVGVLTAAAMVDKKKPNGEKKTAREIEDDTFGPALLGALVGGTLGALIGSRIHVWPTLAERSDTASLKWLAGVPVLIAAQPAKGLFSTACARDGALPTGRLVAIIDWPDYDAYSVDVKRAWELDSTTKHLVPTHTDGVRCRAPYSRTPEPPVAPEREAAALTFTPAEGRARIYVRQTAARPVRGDSILGFNVAIDGQIVGRTLSGTYVVVEVPAGPHTVTVPGADTTVVSIEARADSSYFVKLSHRIGWRRPSSIPPLGSVAVSDQRIVGFDEIPRDPRRAAVVYWWQERPRRLVVPF